MENTPTYFDSSCDELSENFYVRIILFGVINVGKTTLLKSLFGENYAMGTTQRSTLAPHIFRECDSLIDDNVDDIRNNVDNINKDIKKMKSFEVKNYIHRVSTLKNFFNRGERPAHVKLEIIDLPGMNDGVHNVVSSMKTWIRSNIHKFDIIIYLTDINKALESADERNLTDFVKEVIENEFRKNHPIYFIPLINKYDDIKYDPEAGNWSFDDQDEGKQIYDDLNERFSDEMAEIISKYDPQRLYLNDVFIPISAENAYINRVVKINGISKLEEKYIEKLAADNIGKNTWKTIKGDEAKVNEFKNETSIKIREKYDNIMYDTGFNYVRDIIQGIVKKDHKVFALKRLQEQTYLCNLEMNNADFMRCVKNVTKLHALYNQDEIVVLIDKIKNNVNLRLARLVSSIKAQYEKIIVGKTFSNEFDALMKNKADVDTFIHKLKEVFLAYERFGDVFFEAFNIEGADKEINYIIEGLTTFILEETDYSAEIHTVDNIRNLKHFDFNDEKTLNFLSTLRTDLDPNYYIAIIEMMFYDESKKEAKKKILYNKIRHALKSSDLPYSYAYFLGMQTIMLTPEVNKIIYVAYTETNSVYTIKYLLGEIPHELPKIDFTFEEYCCI